MNFSRKKDKELEKLLKLVDLHQSSLEILKIIDLICKNRGIVYTTDSGTLLGHIRHNGFIPWDDDADIIMTRENFNKFIHAWDEDNNNPNLKLLTPSSFNGKFLDMIYRVSDFSIEIKQCEIFKNYDELKHPRVDIFVLDNIPKNNLVFKIHTFRLKILYAFAAAKINYKNPIKRPLIEKIGLNLFKFFGHFISLEYSLRRFEKIAQKYNKKDCKYCHNSSSMLSIDLKFEKKWYITSCYKIFENTELQCSQYYSTILSLLYGDNYMKPKIDPTEFQRHFDCPKIDNDRIYSFYSDLDVINQGKCPNY